MDTRDWNQDRGGRELDPRLEKLIALLYQELPEEEASALRSEIEADPVLRAHWEELQETRTILSKWEIPESAPGFVFVRDSASARTARAVVPRRAGAWLRRLFPVWTWGLAATAAVVAILAVTHFRIEQVPGGFAFRIGAEQPLTASAGLPTAEAGRSGFADYSRYSPAASPFGADHRSGGVPLEGPSSAVMASNESRAPTPAANPSDFLTQEEFRAYVAGMTRTMVALFNEYGDQRDRQMTAFVQAALGEVARQHSKDYEDLSGKIETVGFGLAREQFDTKARLDFLMKQEEPVRTTPVRESRKPDAEGDKQ